MHAMRRYHIKAKKRPLVRMRDPLLDSIRQRAAMLNMTLADLNRATKSRVFWQIYNDRRIPLKVAKKAISLLGGEPTAAWEPIRSRNRLGWELARSWVCDRPPLHLKSEEAAM